MCTVTYVTCDGDKCIFCVCVSCMCVCLFVFACTYVCAYVWMCVCLPYSGLLSLGENLSKFHKWAHYWGNFIMGCYIKFDCGLLLQKLKQTRLCPDGLLTFRPSHGLQNTSVYNCSQSNLSGWVRTIIWQAINALCNKRFDHMRLFSMCTATANRSWILGRFTNKHLVHYWHPDAHVHV